MAVNYVPTYKTYEDASAEARRAQALAEALQQQAYQPIEMTSAAPVSYTQGLAKVLQAYMAGRQQSKAAEAEKQAKKVGREEFQSYVESLSPEQKTMGVGDVAAMQMPTPSIEDGRITHQAAAPILNQKPVMQMTTEGAPDFSKPIMMQTGGPLTPAQRRAKLLEGLGSGNPMVQTIAQMEYNKPSMLGKIGDVQPDKFTPASLAQFQATGNAAVLVPVEKENKAPTAVQEYEYARGQGYKGSFRDFQNERARAGASSTVVSYGAPVAGVNEKGEPVFFQPSRTGGQPSIIPGVRPKPEAMGQAESTAALFADRMSQSAPILDALPPPSIGAAAKAGLPGVGNILTSDQNRQFLQAERNFITAVLRRESGAAISESEFKEARKLYIPQAGDDPQTLQMKKQAREAAINGIARGAGPTYKPPSMPGAPAAGGWGKAEEVR